jgi:Bacterial transglutaminase-like cysteine proteinase BTLCP
MCHCRKAMVNSSLIQPRSSSPGRMLIESGWPHEVLLVTVVRDKKEEGHAVLTVTADKGEGRDERLKADMRGMHCQ